MKLRLLNKKATIVIGTLLFSKTMHSQIIDTCNTTKRYYEYHLQNLKYKNDQPKISESIFFLELISGISGKKTIHGYMGPVGYCKKDIRIWSKWIENNKRTLCSEKNNELFKIYHEIYKVTPLPP